MGKEFVMEAITDKEIETFVLEVKKRFGKEYNTTTELFSLKESPEFYRGMICSIYRFRGTIQAFQESARKEKNEEAMRYISDIDANTILFMANIGEIYLSKKNKPIISMLSKGGKA